MRRAYLALLGLPPSYDRVEQFAADPSPAAFAQLVDQAVAVNRLRAVSAVGDSFPLHASANGKAFLATRIKLADAQKVVAIAEMSDGTYWRASADVIVTLAACIEDLT